MSSYQRVHATCTVEVDISADAFFDALMRWDAIAAWKTPPLPMRRVALFPGHRNLTVPCTRICYPDLDRLPEGVDPATMPEFVSETIMAFDPDTRFVLYRLDGDGPFGLRNYIATTEVDSIDDGHARVTCTGRGDIPETTPLEMMQAILGVTYEEGVIKGTVEIAKS